MGFVSIVFAKGSLALYTWYEIFWRCQQALG